MSVLIKGMRKPENCKECKFFVWKQILGNKCAVDENITFHAVLDGLNVCYERNGDCPLVKVPPHGRLIDADNLVQVIDDEFTEATRTFQNPIELFRKSLLCGFAKDVITAAPTIIEAEGEEK